MRILLTGGTGLIGQALCQHWQRQGHELWVWSRDPRKVQRLCSGARSVVRNVLGSCAAGVPGGYSRARRQRAKCGAMPSLAA